MIDIGRLNKRISFLGYEDEENELGQTTQNEKVLKTCWGSVECVSGREYYEAQKIRSDMTWHIYIRYSKKFIPTSSMLIQYGTRKFKIISVIDYRENHELFNLVCTESVVN